MASTLLKIGSSALFFFLSSILSAFFFPFALASQHAISCRVSECVLLSTRTHVYSAHDGTLCRNKQGERRVSYLHPTHADVIHRDTVHRYKHFY